MDASAGSPAGTFSERSVIIEPTADVLAVLRAATAQRHATLDAGLPIGHADATIDDYRQHLLMLHAWLGPLEAWLAAYHDGPQDAALLPPKRRLAMIEADLGDAAPAPSATAIWPQDASAAYRWGVCYVVEGSQLGGAVLYQRLKEQCAPHPLHYLQGEVGGPGPRWRVFMQALRAQIATPAQIEQARRGACDAFDRILALR